MNNFSRPVKEECQKYTSLYSVLPFKLASIIVASKLYLICSLCDEVLGFEISEKNRYFELRCFHSFGGCAYEFILLQCLLQVYWGHISIIYAEMNCMRDLLKYHWKYFINLSGFMYPAHSNRDLVNILQLYDGANDVEGSYKRYVILLEIVARVVNK